MLLPQKAIFRIMTIHSTSKVIQPKTI